MFPFQDLAAEQSSMPYRAPELFDVKTGITLDEKVDIWVYSHSSLVWDEETDTEIVPWVPAFCLSIFPFALRDNPDDGTGRIHGYGGHERAVQVPSRLALLGRLQGSHQRLPTDQPGRAPKHRGADQHGRIAPAIGPVTYWPCKRSLFGLATDYYTQ